MELIGELVPFNPGLFFDKKFPTTPEEFDRVGVIQTRLRIIFVQIDLVRWVNAMFEKYPYTNDLPEKEKLTYCTRIMSNSFDRINYLYKIQAAYNLSIGISINVKPGNSYYDIFIMAHNLWTALTIKFINIFVDTLGVYNYHDFDILSELVNQTPNNKGKEIMDLVIKNEELHEIIKQMEDNLDEAISHIEKYEAYQQRETNRE